MLQDDGVLALLLEHVDILALLNLIGHIEDGSLFGLLVFFGGFGSVLFFCAAVFCLCLIGGMKRQPAFPAALAVMTGLLLAFPGFWGAPFYGIVLQFSGGEGMLRISGGALLLLGMLGFWGGMVLREKRGCGAPVRRPQVPSLLDEDEDDEE